MEGKVIIDYTNWRGERRTRAIFPITIEFGSTEWHPEKQWLLSALDLEDEHLTEKKFALKDIHSWKTA